MPRSAQPEIPARLKSYGIHIPDFAPVFHWLHREAGLTWAEIAAAFGITPDRLRAIASRSPYRVDRSPLPGNLDRFEAQLIGKPLIVVPSVEVREALGITSCSDYVVLNKKRREELYNFEQQIDAERQHYELNMLFEDGLFRMRSHIRRVGEPHSALLIRILARLRHHSAWFLVHLGRTSSAIDQARRSMALSATAYHESGDASNLARTADTGLVLSIAYQLRNLPTASLEVLKTVSDIYRRLGTNPGSEYFRQTGTSQMLLFKDQAAADSLIQAGKETERGGMSAATVDLNSNRQISLLNRPQWSDPRDTLANANCDSALTDIRHSMNVHWRVAAGLATGDPKIVDRAMGLLGPRPPAHFGHQATIRYLLDVAPRLRLEGETLRRWIRYLLYSNAFRDE